MTLDLPTLAASQSSFLSSLSATSGSSSLAVVMLGEPGDTRWDCYAYADERALAGDDELAIVLARTLIDMKLVRLLAVVTCAQPARLV